MYQKQDKSIAIRMPSDLVDKLDAVSAHFSYCTRSEVLRAFVSRIFEDLSESEVWEIMRVRSEWKEYRKVLHMHNPDL